MGDPVEAIQNVIASLSDVVPAEDTPLPGMVRTLLAHGASFAHDIAQYVVSDDCAFSNSSRLPSADGLEKIIQGPAMSNLRASATRHSSKKEKPI